MSHATAERMPISPLLLDDILILSLRGEHEPRALYDALTRALDGDGLRPRGVLVDVVLSTTIIRQSTNEVREMAAVLADFADTYRLRIALVGATDLQFGLMRLASAHIEAREIESCAFREVGPAMAWLRHGPAAPPAA